MSAPTVFLSAVSKDFGLPFLDKLRTTIHDELRCICRYRGNLKLGTGVLPEKLREEIESANCVIHLVGPRFGYGPTDVLQLDLECTPAGEYWKAACKSWWPHSEIPSRRSYTQMEYDFARQLRRPIYVIFVDDPALIANAADQDSAEAQLQAAHRKALKAYGHDYVTVDSCTTVEAIASKLPIIVGELKKQIDALHDFLGGVGKQLDRIESAVTTARAPAPFQRPPLASAYFGRGKLVSDLEERLRKHKRVEVWGGPGLGKTALAAQAVANIVGDDPAALAASPFPHGIVFLDLYTLYKGSLDYAWHALANAFDDALPTDMLAGERARRASAHRQALVILEGAEVLDTRLAEFIGVLAPETTLLVLTRQEAQTAAGRRIKLDALLDETDAINLLKHLSADAGVSLKILTGVWEQLGGHPLALTWAGSQLGDATQPPANFLRDLAAQPFRKLTEPGGQPEHTLKWMFDRSMRLLGESTRNVLAAAARIAEPFGADFAAVAGGQESDLQRLVQLAFLRVTGDGWQYAHALAAQYSRELPLPAGMLEKLGRWAVTGIATADARCQAEGTGPLGLALAHAIALLSHDGASRALGIVAKVLIYHDPDSNPIGIRRGRLDYARRAVETVRQWQEQAAAEEKFTSGWQRELSVSLNKLGDLAVAQGDLAGALRNYSESKTIAERLAASDPANAGRQRDLSSSLSRLGDLAVVQGDLIGALRDFTEAKGIAQRLAASDPANAELQRDLIISVERLGDVARARGDIATSISHFEESRDGWAKLIWQHPGNIGLQRGITIPLDRLGDLAMAQGDLTGALRDYAESKTISERLATSDPANAEWQRDLSVSLRKLGVLAVAQGDLAGASRYFTEGKAIAERLVASDPAHTGWQRDLSILLDNLGDLAAAQGDLAVALRHYSESKTIRERLAARDPANADWQRDLWVGYWSMANLCEKLMQSAEATAWWKKAHATLAGMQQRGIHVSPEDKKFLEILRTKVGAGKSPRALPWWVWPWSKHR